MKKIIYFSVIFLVLSLSIASVYAVTQEELNQAKALINSNISCNKLSNDQLEIIGEYYMEQMMPGEAHKRAHEMMGLKEGSEAEEQFHINMAKRSYCGENISIMAGGGMMGNNYQAPKNNNTYQNNFFGFEIFFYILLILVIIVLILIIILLINKSKNNAKQRRKTK